MPKQTMPITEAPLRWIVFLAGVSTMAVEMLAARLIAPFFGTSLLIWSLLLFSILAALSIGYLYGGRRADREPRVEPLGKTLLLASGLLALVPCVCRDFLHLCVVTGSLGLQIAGLIGTIVLLCVPVTLLGSVGPTVIRLRAQDPTLMGKGAGSVLGISTIGSIIGTYFPALVGIPLLGTLRSFFVLSLLVGFSGVLLTVRQQRWKAGILGLALPALLLVRVNPGLLHFALLGKGALGMISTLTGYPPHLLDRSRGVVFEGETVYNCIQVRRQTIEDGSRGRYFRNLLILNEGYAVHSVATSSNAWCFPFVGSVWDYMGLLPTLSEPSGPSLDAALVGLAGGTVARQMVELYRGQYKVNVCGAEIDPLILQVARDYFFLPPEVQAFAQDGRTFLTRKTGPFDIIVTDAYRQPYIPFHLTTQEYFRLVRSRLKPKGICSINVGATSAGESILAKIRSTMSSVFEEVYVFEVPRASPLFTNFLIVAARSKGVIHSPTAPSNRVAQKLKETYPKLNAEITRLLAIWGSRLVPAPPATPSLILTDDCAPVEFLTDAMILRTLADPRLKIDEIQK